MQNPHYPHANFPHIADDGDGNFTNPILFADYSDPDVIRVGQDYYMVSSSFNFVPGLPVLHSTDLVNWKWLCNALLELPSRRYDEVHPGCGVWAPAIRHHGGLFWIFFPMPDEGIYLITAQSAVGPWSEPRLVQAGKGLIDPCPLWDDDGKAYLIFAYAGSRSGIKHKLHVRSMAGDGSALIGDGQIVFDGTKDHPTTEGPKFHKKDGYYYISAPAGGVPTGWQLVLRSKSIYGPYEERVVLAQHGSQVNGPHQGALVDDVEGNWWFLHFQERQPYGRITHLQPVAWQDGWPLMGEEIPGSSSGRPVLSHRKPAGTSAIQAPASSDEFDAPVLGLQWAFPGNAQEGAYSLSERPGFLRLRSDQVPQADCRLSVHVLSQKIPARSFLAETAIDFESSDPQVEAGLAILGLDNFQLSIGERETKGIEKRSLFLKKNNEILLTLPCPEGRVRLAVDFAPGGSIQFGYAADDGKGGATTEIQWVGPWFQAREGVWVGARIGLFCLSKGPLPKNTYADFDYLQFSNTARLA